MGNYITQTAATSGDLTNKVGNALVTKLWSDTTGAVSQTFINDSISDAEAEIDAELIGVYPTIPISPAPDIIKMIAKNLAVANGYDRHPEFFTPDGNNPWFVQRSRARELLKRLRDGDMRLEDESADKPSNIGGTVISSATYFITDSTEDTMGSSGGF